MAYKIVFFDIDGTLINSEKNISNETIAAISKLQKNGIKVVLATGRSPIHIKEIADQINVNSYICYNGSIVFYEGNKIYEEVITPSSVSELVKIAKTKSHPLIFLGENLCYSSNGVCNKINASFEFLNVELPNYQFDKWKESNVFQMYLYCESYEQENYEKAFPELTFTRWHEFAVDVNLNSINKSIGIKKMLKHLNIKSKQAVAFGDNLNDLEMLKYVGMGIAMGNAVEETKSNADFVTKHIDDNGIFYALEKFKLI